MVNGRGRQTKPPRRLHVALGFGEHRKSRQLPAIKRFIHRMNFIQGCYSKPLDSDLECLGRKHKVMSCFSLKRSTSCTAIRMPSFSPSKQLEILNGTFC